MDFVSLDFLSLLDQKILVFFLLAQKGIGRQRARAILLELSKTQIKPKEIRKYLQPLLIKYKCKNIFDKSISWNEIENFYYSNSEAFLARGVSVVYYREKAFPHSLRSIADSPLLLFYKGSGGLFSQRGVAMVGTRKITPYGKLVTKKITAEVVADGFVTISGCMYGVDELVHRETMKYRGKTIAVLGYGFDYFYPSQAQALQEAIIAAGGTVVTEYFPWIEPRPGFFLDRNRLIAGLSQATIVLEAAEKSGSHRTAVSAAENGRQVFAVPGPITNPYSEGTKWLINQGALLITSGFEVAQHLGVASSPVRSSNKNLFVEGDATNSVIQVLQSGPSTVEDLACKTSLSLREVLRTLGYMELDGTLAKDGILWYLK